MKTCKGILAALMVICSLGRAHAVPGELTAGFWAEIKALVTFCKATKELLSTTQESDFFATVYSASYAKCDVVLPSFTCAIIGANAETFETAILKNASLPEVTQYQMQKMSCGKLNVIRNFRTD